MTRRPHVTIGMPVFNSNPEYFNKAISDLLAQTVGDFEIVISDNASSPDSERLYRDTAASDDRIRYIRHEKNVGAVRNFACLVEEARGEIFVWAADDDERAPSFLERGLEALSDPRFIAAQYQSAIIDKVGARTGCTQLDVDSLLSNSAVTRIRAMRAPNYNFITYGLHRTEILRDLDLETPSIFWDFLQSTDLFLHGPIVTVPGELFSYRLDQSKDTDEYRDYQHMGDAARGLGKNKYTDSAFLFLARVLSSKAKLSPLERISCFGVLASFLLQRGWFIYDELYRTLPRLKVAVGERDALSILLLGAKVTALSPTYPWRRWKSRR